jgi:hypothetical protein
MWVLFVAAANFEFFAPLKYIYPATVIGYFTWELHAFVDFKNGSLWSKIEEISLLFVTAVIWGFLASLAIFFGFYFLITVFFLVFW